MYSLQCRADQQVLTLLPANLSIAAFTPLAYFGGGIMVMPPWLSLNSFEKITADQFSGPVRTFVGRVCVFVCADNNYQTK